MKVSEQAIGVKSRRPRARGTHSTTDRRGRRRTAHRCYVVSLFSSLEDYFRGPNR